MPATNLNASLSVASAEPNQLSSPQQPSRLTPVPDNAYLHEIRSGESLYSIARLYEIDADELVRANGLPSADRIFVGQKLIIPGRQAVPTKIAATTPRVTPLPRKSITETGSGSMNLAAKPDPKPVRVASTDPKQISFPANSAPKDGKFRWPLSGTILIDFATSKSGINISAQEGTSVRAIGDGTVIYAGDAVEGYGNLVLIKHDNGYVSAYAHLKNITVAKGESVTSGEAVGAAGMTGSVSRPQLHFELRKGATPVDPIPMLAG